MSEPDEFDYSDSTDSAPEPDYTVVEISIPKDVFMFFTVASGGKAEEAITNALRTLMEMFSV